MPQAQNFLHQGRYFLPPKIEKIVLKKGNKNAG